MLNPPSDDLTGMARVGCGVKAWLRALPIVILFNTLIALLLTLIAFGQGFAQNLLFAQCIGLSIFTLQSPIDFSRDGIRPFVLYLGAIGAGVISGYALALTLLGKKIPSLLTSDLRMLGVILLVSFLASAVIFYFFWARMKLARFESEIQQEKIQRLTSEKHLLDAHLKLLQAQVEPHFLFNTLANVVSLIEADPARAKNMLETFIRYLRSSLTMMREEHTTLQAEIEIVRAYLDLLQIRMGERLAFDFAIPADLLDTPFPTMALQTLVENAVKHGLEPKIEGGYVRVTATACAGRLTLAVEDNGLGFHGENAAGLGLANLRQRLELLYGAEARLIIEEKQASGTRVQIEIPYAHGPDC